MVVPCMRTERRIIILMAAIMAGWLCAVLMCNGLFYKNIVNYEVLYQGVAECWERSAERGRMARISLLVFRILEMSVIFVLTVSRFRRAASLFLGSAAGFSGGIFFSLLIWSCGVSGGLVFLAAGFPQNLAYLPCMFLLWMNGISDRMLQKDRLLCLILFLTAIGIWLELMISPLILKLF